MAKSFFDAQDEPLTPTATATPGAALTDKAQSDKKIKKIALIVIPLLICAVAGAYFFFKIVRKPKTYSDNSRDATAIADSAEAITNSYVALEPMIVNLAASEKGKPVYLRLTLTLRVSSEAETKLVQAKTPMIIDNFQAFLTGLRPADLSGTGGILLLKEELTKRINKIVAPMIIKDVLFKEMMIN